MSTSTPRSAVISVVTSSGKPNVSWSLNAAEPGSTGAPEASSSSRIPRPVRNVWRKRSSSRVITPVMKSRFLTTSGYASPITAIASSTRPGMTSFSAPSR